MISEHAMIGRSSGTCFVAHGRRQARGGGLLGRARSKWSSCLAKSNEARELIRKTSFRCRPLFHSIIWESFSDLQNPKVSVDDTVLCVGFAWSQAER